MRLSSYSVAKTISPTERRQQQQKKKKKKKKKESVSCNDYRYVTTKTPTDKEFAGNQQATESAVVITTVASSVIS
jgi:hypothetical protein